eukprot:TRINITY_DN1500_c0_g1_i1.p1 TRINITY_DN1500_c0_g1~~TRINITY_DN1500_c0_g1_i1.p1  ORF type:complete len:315 (-),score=65.11 TRINITY_DN1500_c0_g1_i1:306-1229(-)
MGVWALILAFPLFAKGSMLTFFVASDTHLDVCQGQKDFNANTLAVKLMNALPGTKFPKAVGGGVVREPEGVIVPGDLINDGWWNPESPPQQWPNYTALYGVRGEGLLRYPTFEGFGNHDGDGFVREALATRNRQRLAVGQVSRVSENGLHTSWDWRAGGHRVHFLNLNLYPGRHEGSTSSSQPAGSLDFMARDLKQSVGQSGVPVVIISHYGFNCEGWWTAHEMEEFRVEAAPYNVVAFIHGHTHEAEFYTWKGIDVYNAPAVQPNPSNITAGFLVFEIDSWRRTLRAVMHTNRTWGSLHSTKRIRL